MTQLNLFPSELFTPKKMELIKLVATGMTNKLIAYELSLSEATVKTYLSQIFDKTGSENRVQLTNWYRDNA